MTANEPAPDTGRATPDGALGAGCLAGVRILDLTVCLAAFLGLGRVLNVLGIEETCLVDVYAPSESNAAVS